MRTSPCLIALLCSTAAAAQTVTVTETGYLLGPTDAPIAGATPMRFRLWSATADGTLLWTGELSASQPCVVSVSAGWYSVALGSDCGAPIPASAFTSGSPVWLELEVDGVTLVPRQALRAAPAATSFTGALAGDVTGTQGATVVTSVGGVSAANVAAGAALANGGTATNAWNTIVRRNATGGFAAGTVAVEGLQLATGAAQGRILTSDASGNAAWAAAPVATQWTTNGSAISYVAGNVGVGSASPQATLDVGGTVAATGLKLPSGAAAGRLLSSDANGNASWVTPPVNSQWTTSGTSITYAAGNVGVGSANPQATLDVGGTVAATGLKIPTGAAAGRVLTSDANGNATWQAGTFAGGSIQVGNDAAACTSSNAGTVRWTGSLFQGCNGSAWVTVFGSVGASSASPAASCVAVKAAGLPSGPYWLTINGAPTQVWCDNTTGTGGWIDLVKTMTISGVVPSAYVTKFFTPASPGANPDAAVGLAAATGTGGVTGLPGFYIYMTSLNASYAYIVTAVLDPSRIGITIADVQTSYRMQGAEDGTRCNSGNWVPMSGPGYNGGNTGYLAVCRSGYTCIQGTSTLAQDAPLNVTYSVSGASSTLWMWDLWVQPTIGTTASGCTRDAEIPTSTPAIWFSQLLIR